MSASDPMDRTAEQPSDISVVATDTTVPFTILIGALGGEGGGVLTDWLVAAAMAADYPVQSTSIPGVAQRTGATTYYLEIFPLQRQALNGREPVLGLYPSPGRVDLAVASELLEAGRITENGFVSPERTTMVASTHRIYAIAEKSALGDGRFDTAHLPAVIRQMARQAYLFDLPRKARESKSVLNAVLLGIIVGSGVLPLAPELFRQAIREKGVAVESNLRGLETGIALAMEGDGGDGAAAAEPTPVDPEVPAALLTHITGKFPLEVHDVLKAGVARLVDFQGPKYAASYLERLTPLAEVEALHGNGHSGYELTRETARHLAAWMSYEDLIRVADLKTRRGRFLRVRSEAGAGAGEPLRITEFLDPGLDELCAVLPPFLARAVLRFVANRPRLAGFRKPMKVRTDTVSGFLKLWLMARLRRFRPWTFRFGEEQRMITRWLGGVKNAAALDYGLGVEAAHCARLLKGYGDTYHRGRANFERIFSVLIEPACAAGAGNGAAAKVAANATERVREARLAALADEEGASLNKVMTPAL